MNRYLKIFMATGIPYGAIMGIYYSFRLGVLSGLMTGLLAGILFGIIMSAIIGLLHTWSIRKLFTDNQQEADKVHHIRNVELCFPYEKVFNLCIKSLSIIKKCEIQESDQRLGIIIARAGATWRTWGDEITFDLRRINDSSTYVELSSRPALRTTLVDYGKNFDNVQKIVDYLNRADKGAV